MCISNSTEKPSKGKCDMSSSNERIEFYSFSRRFINDYVYFSITALQRLELTLTCRFSTETDMLHTSFYNKKNKPTIGDIIKKTVQSIKMSNEYRESYFSKARLIKIKRASRTIKGGQKCLNHIGRNKASLNITERAERITMQTARENQKPINVFEKRRESTKQKIAQKLINIERIKLKMDHVRSYIERDD